MAEKHQLPPARYEARDMDMRLVWIGAPALLAVVAALVLLVSKLFPGDTTDRMLQLPLRSFPDPQLQANPRADLARDRAMQIAQLNSAPIPIDEAMHQIADEGIEGWPP